MRNVAGRDALDESLDDSPSVGRWAPNAFAEVVETALAEALRLAATAHQWALVASLAEELAARHRDRGARQRQPPNPARLAIRARAR